MDLLRIPAPATRSPSALPDLRRLPVASYRVLNQIAEATREILITPHRTQRMTIGAEAPRAVGHALRPADERESVASRGCW